MNWKHLIILLLFSIGIKVVYLGFSIAIDGSNGNLFEKYVSIAKKNDSYWYQKIAADGYSKTENKRDLGYSEGANFKQSEWAFFPFYPALNAFTSKYLGVGFDMSAFIWSILFSVLSILGVYWFGNVFFNDENLSLFSAMVMFSFPFSFYFSMFYTEAVFLTLTIFSFLCIRYKRYLLLAILLIPLTLVRPNGIIILIPLYLYFLEQNGIMHSFNISWNRVFGRLNLVRSLAFITAPLAFLAYGIYQYKMTGYFFAFSIAQAGWYRETMFPLLAFFRSGDLATQFNSVYTILVVIYAVWIWKKLPLSLNIFLLIGFLLPLTSGSVTSMTRFISVMFPLFMVLSSSIYKLNYKYLILSFIFALNLLSFYTWMVNMPISF